MKTAPIISCGIRIGAGIEGTTLLRQYRGDEEIPPLSCPQVNVPLVQRIRRAKLKAKASGYRQVQVEKLIYEVE